MEFIKKFNGDLTSEKQIQDSQKVRAKHPDRVPVLVDRLSRQDPQIDKHKYLIPTDLCVAQFMPIVRKRLVPKLSSEQALYLFIDGKLVPNSALFSSIFKEHEKNGFLVMLYGLESTFGGKGGNE
jgi:GABA(A) receptor-associated protein